MFVTVGVKAAFDQSYDLLAPGGAAVLVGMTGTGVKSEFIQVNLADKSQRIIGAKMGALNIHVEIPKLVKLYQDGNLMLDELISGCFPIEEINRAMDEVRRGTALRNVIVFD